MRTVLSVLTLYLFASVSGETSGDGSSDSLPAAITVYKNPAFFGHSDNDDKFQYEFKPTVSTQGKTTNILSLYRYVR